MAERGAPPRRDTARRRPVFVALVALGALLGAANLLAGMAGGLARLGWTLPAGAQADHGAVMVCGFFGTVIALERAVALHRLAGLVAPLASGLGGLAVWALGWPMLGAGLWLLASLALAGLYLMAGLTRAWSLHLKVELVAALIWGLGTLAWAAGAPQTAGLAWMSFLVGTIAGERRELMQFVRLSPAARAAFVAMMALAAAGLGLQALGEASDPAAFIASLGQALWWSAAAALALWLLRWDLAPRLWARPGWPGHTGRCLSLGYLWLLLAGALALGDLSGLAATWPALAALAPLATHALLLGFVFAMVFGHAPIILPALGAPRPRPSRAAALPLGLLTLSLVARGGALVLESPALMAWAGASHALAIVLFAMVMARAVLLGRRERRAPARQASPRA